MLEVKNKLSKADLLACAEKFRTKPSYCVDNGNQGYPSLFPLQNCDETSEALMSSRIVSRYHDCPGSIDNEGVINIHRLVSHIKGNSINSKPESCSYVANNTFANLNFAFNNKKAWPMKICYTNEVTKKVICNSYIPGNNPTAKLSENNVIANILKETISAPEETTCKLVSKKKYNPVRLEYRSGCYITYEASNCSTLHCPKTVIYDQKIIKNLKYKGLPIFDYAPTSFTNEKYAMTNIIAESFKVTSKRINNLTELNYFFDNFKKGIVHGVGCIEDLVPAHFKRESFNQCRPVPFIIDGSKKVKTSYLLTLRTALDDVHSPRTVKWNYIFSSVASYQQLHPLNSWVLYGVK